MAPIWIGNRFDRVYNTTRTTADLLFCVQLPHESIIITQTWSRCSHSLVSDDVDDDCGRCPTGYPRICNHFPPPPPPVSMSTSVIYNGNWNESNDLVSSGLLLLVASSAVQHSLVRQTAAIVFIFIQYLLLLLLILMGFTCKTRFW